MTVASVSVDLHEAINKAWDDSGLDTEFKKLWLEDAGDSSEFITLNDQMAAPKQPWPYCVYEIRSGVTNSRMTGSVTAGRKEIRDIPVLFKIHGQEQGNITAKKQAADLLDAVLQVFGGHPTVVPRDLTLNHGHVLITQYQTDNGVKTTAEEYLWVLEYIMRLDVPVAA